MTLNDAGSSSTETDGAVRFGQFAFDPGSGELFRSGRPVHLAPTPARVLARLLRAPGKVVTRDRLELDIWGQRSDDGGRSLNFAIRQVRTALGDAADSPRYVETLRARGYRFIAPVEREGPPDHDAAAPPAGRIARKAGGWRPTLLAPALIMIAWVAMRGADPVADGAPPMLAVLPLERLSADSTDEYFVTGLRDELITALARLDPERLGVIGRGSVERYRGDPRSAAQIARELGVDYVIEGSVTPEADRVRVVVSLVDAQDGTLVWAERFEHAEPTTVELERAIAARVATAVAPEVGTAVAGRGERAGPGAVAREHYLKGRYLLRHGPPDRLREAIDWLRQAVEAAPEYAAAREALGLSLRRAGRFEEAQRELERSLRLEPRSTEARVALADDALLRQWQPVRARRHLELAVAIDAGSVLGHQAYARYLSLLGEHERAIAEIRTALRLDPVSPLVTADVGRIYYRAGRFEEAERFCAKTLELLPDAESASYCLINIAMLRGRPADAVPEALRILAARKAEEATVSAVRGAEASVAMTRFWRWRLEWLRSLAAGGAAVDVPIAQTHLWLDEPEQAIDALQRALESRSPVLPLVSGDPCFARLHDDPRFQRIVASTGLPPLEAPRIS